MRKLLIVAVLAVAILATGCPIQEKYLELRTEYIERRETIREMCTAGTISATTCDALRKADVALTAADVTARKAEATRKEIKASLQELEGVIDQQKDAILNSGPGG